VNIDISALESDVRSLKGSVNEYITKIETNASNIVAMNGIIGCIDNYITSLEEIVAVLEERVDYRSDICNMNNSILDIQSQIESITIPDYTSDINNINDSILMIQY
jgi:peptidoglycan hydrolase CwlO-like protein